MRAEDAQAYLKSQEVNWKKTLDLRLEKAPPETVALVREIRKTIEAPYVSDPRKVQEREQKRKELVLQMDGLTPQERTDLFRVLFPHFPEMVERVWQAIKTQPYQEGYIRRSFRAPHHPLTLERAWNWLLHTWTVTRDYDQPLEWFAVWAGRLPSYHKDELGYLFAEAINAGQDNILQVLKDTASGEHEVGVMGRHITRAFLTSANEGCWTYIEKLLLAAQRQEGLRQVILETIDEAHPRAFLQMVELILKEDLLRFSAVVRAVDVWFGWMFEATDRKPLERGLTTFLDFLKNPEAAEVALTSGNGEAVYLALWARGFENALDALPRAAELLQDPDAPRRYAAAAFLKATGLPEAEVHDLKILQDPDLRIATLALPNRWTLQQEGCPEDLFDVLEGLASRTSDRSSMDPILWPWTTTVATREQVLSVMPAALGSRPLQRLVPHIPHMDTYTRAQVAGLVGKHSKASRDLRELLFRLLADSSAQVREAALSEVKKLTLHPEESRQVEGLLTRKSADLRRGSLELLLGQPREAALESASRLVQAGKTEQRQAGLELLTHLQKREVPAKQWQTVLQGFEARNHNEQELLSQLQKPEEQLSLKNGLGLFDPGQLTPVEPVRHIKRSYFDARLLKLLTELDHLIHQHRETEVSYSRNQYTFQGLLGNVSGWHLTHIAMDSPQDFPLYKVWERWWDSRPKRGPADLSQLRWFLHVQDERPHYRRKEKQPHQLLPEQKLPKLQYLGLISDILLALQPREEASGHIDFLLDLFESQLSLIDPRMPKASKEDLYAPDPREVLSYPSGAVQQFPWDCWTPEQQRRFWKLHVYQDRGFPLLGRMRAPLEVVLHAYLQGMARQEDVLDQLIGEPAEHHYSYRANFHALHQLSGRKPNPRLPQDPRIQHLVRKVTERIVQVESSRADLSTPASGPAQSIRYLQGAEAVLKMLSSLGKDPLIRGYSYHNESRSAIFSHLIRVSFPAETETQEMFQQWVKQYRISEARLLDLAMFAPQWSVWVARTLGWDGLSDAIYWLHAHTKDQQWFIEQDIKEVWEAEISERTPLTGQDLVDGAVDVQWFRDVHARLGEQRFAQLYRAAKYASSAGGHKRAELFSRAILGEVQEQDLVQQIQKKRHQDSVRALGLLPVQGKEAVLNRYRTIQDFVAQSKQFGAQKQASEQLAGRIGLQNLARTAGYADPERLMWAMETEEVQRLNGRRVELDSVTLTLTVNTEGDPELGIEKAGKALKTVPAALKKHPEYRELQDAKNRLGKQKSRMREAFEFAMVRGDHFSLQELQTLLNHPVLRPMLLNLLWVRGERDLGRLDSQGFVTLQGTVPLTDEAYRMAHPHDLFQQGQWQDWQRHFFEHQLQQPFKQVFREYYLRTPQEDGSRSARYGGQQVNPKQALALLKTRNWISVPEEGVRKTFHTEGISAWLEFEEGYFTPMEVEGLTIASVVFTERGKHEPLPLESVPPRLFSETMRDVDLVVSVAHVGGVDPEASQSTIEMRESLLRETLRLLKIDNVRLQGSHALIAGHFGDYTVHLGSGTVHRQPGGAVCIVPVHSQHRGRIFLPFADSDPRTAEVVSKVLLLARDRQIQDPSILEQLA